jgi:hypothetical protein
VRKVIQVLTASTFFVFLAYSGWRIIFSGVMEEASFDVEHRAAGAGDLGLVAQLVGMLATMVLAFAWLWTERRRGLKWVAACLLVISPVIFYFTARGLQRFPPTYSEGAFQKLCQRFREDIPLRAEDVIAELGAPLMKRKLPDGNSQWSYSYMPSCGFGWDKKNVFVDSSGRVIEIYSFSEP